jgi:hypothetical protein
MDAMERRAFGLGLTQVFARVGQDPLVHVVADGSNGEWKLACGSTWFHESTVAGTKDHPTCIRCIVEDMWWWQRLRGATKPATFIR